MESQTPMLIFGNSLKTQFTTVISKCRTVSLETE